MGDVALEPADAVGLAVEEAGAAHRHGGHVEALQAHGEASADAWATPMLRARAEPPLSASRTRWMRGSAGTVAGVAEPSSTTTSSQDVIVWDRTEAMASARNAGRSRVDQGQYRFVRPVQPPISHHSFFQVQYPS